MKKHIRYFAAAILTFSVLLTGCSSEKNDFKISENSVIETDDLKSSGKYSRSVNTEAYEMPDGMPSIKALSFDKYESSDEEVFAFDDSGRLIYYSNTAKNNSKKELSKDELEAVSNEVLSACVVNSDEFSEIQEDYDKTPEEGKVPYRRTLRRERDDGADEFVIIGIDNCGTLKTFEAYYYHVLSDDEKSYFNEKVNAYVEAVNENYSLQSWSYTAQYHKSDNAVLAMYNFDFTETDGTSFCEQVCFEMKADKQQ